MKKHNIMKSLLSLILSVSMILTGLGLTVHASTVNAVSDLPETEASIGEPAPGEPEGTATSPGETGNELPAGTNEPVSSEPEPGEQEGEFTDGEKDSDPGAIDGAKKESGGLSAGPLLLPGFEVAGRGIGLFGAIEDNLITAFELTIIEDGNVTTVIEDKENYEFDVDNLNSVVIKYGLTKPNVLEVAAGDTYTINLPNFFNKDHDTSSSPTSIIIGDVQIGTFIIKNGQVIITFNEHADDFDNQEFFVNVSGTFDTDVFSGVEEVDIIVPYSDGTSFEATIRAEQEEYEGEDKKTPGIGYYFNDQDEKVYLGEDGKNPTHVDWTVRVNDNTETLSNVKIVDGLGSGLTLVADSFVVERIIRDYQNNETKEVVPEGEYTVTPDDVGPGFTLEFIDDNISHAYDITYTTALTKPDGGGDRDFNNTARIIYEGNTEGKDVSNEFEGTWSETLPVIVKEGSATDDPHRLDWTVRYNFGKENLGTVTLTDTLSTGHGALIPGTLLVYEVNTDIDGNIVGELGDPIDDEDLDIDIDGGTFSINDLDANGKAYYITFSTSVPVGLNDVGITNTIADDEGDDPNTSSDTVTVNTIPTGGKVGEQLVDEEGNPYIEWTITMNTEKVNVGSIRIYDVFNPGGTNPDYLDFDTSDGSLFELKKDGVVVADSTFSISNYTHTEDDEHNGKTGFELLIPNAGPHTYEFVYRTYYTVTGMNQPHLANEATLLFLQGGDGSGPGIGDPIPGTSPDYSITGPKAGIEKSGYYVHPENTVGTEDRTTQLIQWSIVINESRILFDELEVSDKLTSDNKANFTYDQTSFVVEDISNAASPETLTSGDDYTLTFDPDGSGFTITFIDYDSSTGKGILPSNAKFRISYTTSVDDTTNLEHENEASLVWQGGTEKKGDTVPERTSGIDKAADITIDANGNKIINWTIDFNSEENVLKNVELTDKYSSVGTKPENIKLYKLVDTVYVPQTLVGTAISFNDTEGTFTVDIGDIDAVPYRLTYTSTLSAAQELEDAVSNSAKITYTGNTEGETDSKEIPKPELVIDKNATDLEKPSADNDLTKPQISWSIAVNIGEDSTNPNNIVNLQNAVLKDIIPGDQSLLIDTIVVSRVGDTDFVLDDDAITAGENDFSIELPDGAYGYLVTFKTEILEYPAFSYAYSDEIEDLGFDPNNDPNKLDRYFNYAELTNYFEDTDPAKIKKAKDDAYQDYFADDTNNNNSKTAAVNEDTEDIEWTATVNPQGLTIKNAVITDTLSKNQYYLKDSVVVKAGETPLTPSSETVEGDYDLVFETVDGNPTFRITFNNDEEQINTPITVSYSSRLNPELIGNITVSNKLILTGGEAGKVLSEVTQSTTTSQWSYGGGGSGQTLTFVLNKENPGGIGIPDAVFKFIRINTAGNEIVGSDLTATTDGYGAFTFSNTRAGRYIATEVFTPEGYVKLTNPIYLIVGYTNPADYEYADDDLGEENPLNPYTLTITNAYWVPASSNEASTAGNVLTIVNQHKAIDFALEAEKTLSGYKNLTAGLFSFELYKVLPEGSEPAVELLQTKKNAAPEAGEEAGKITFDAISYDLPGEYKYQIREKLNYLNDTSYPEEDGSHGVTFDETIHDITVTVTNDTVGILTATASYGEDVPEFENSYLANPVDATIEASKELINKDLQEGQFFFELDGHIDTVTGENVVVSNAADGTFSFTINYTEAGTYTYTLRELLPDSESREDNTDYDDSEYEVEVVVIDNGEGQLVVDSITYGGEDELPVFSNIYYASIVLQVEKILHGRDLEEGEFKFKLTQIWEWIFDEDFIEEEIILQPEVANDASGKVSFDEITYYHGSIYLYSIEELPGDLPGIRYDDTVIYVLVIVEDNQHSGQLEADAIYVTMEVDDDGNPIAFDEILEEPAFTNFYVSEEATIRGSKILTGDLDLTEGMFSFELLTLDDNGEIDGSIDPQIVENDKNGNFSFATITYHEAGEYNYIVREVEGDLPGVTYDAAEYEVTVVVTVDNDETGKLVTEVIYPTENGLIFTNSYLAAPTSVTLEAVKTLKGKDLADKQFSFDLLDSTGKVLETVKNKADGSIAFSEFDYDTAGEYVYTLREVKGSEPGIIYDKSEFEIMVVVTDDGEGMLHATVVYSDEEAPVFRNEFSQELYDEFFPHTPKTGEDDLFSLLGLALMVAGLALGAYTWQNLRSRKKKEKS